ncbi:MAG: SDR family oxidoreductase [Rubrobacter sp.]
MTQGERRVAVVVGASSGIGAATARALAGSGMKVALAARRRDALAEVRRFLPEGAASIVVPTDVTDRAAVKELIRRTERELGPPDILVNCAGVMYFTLMKNLHEDDWERTVDVVCKGLLNSIGAALPGMLSRGRGHIVTISSDAGQKVFPGLSVYSGAKSFVEFVSQGLRLETVGTGLKVTTIQPGNTATDLLSMSRDEEAMELYGEPTGARTLDPEDVARAVLYAVSQPEHVAVNEVLVEPRDEPI